MPSDDHKNMKKIQCWIPIKMWDVIVSQGYTSQTTAVIKAFEKLLEDPCADPQDIQSRSPNIPELRAQIEGLQMLLQEKDKRIEDLRRESENLGIFAHYFKSLEYRRLETSTEKPDIRTHRGEEEPASSPVEAHIVQEEREIVTQEPEEKLARKLGKAHTGEEEEALIKKLCKNCNQPFETSNPRKETCSDKCRCAFSRRQNLVK